MAAPVKKPSTWAETEKRLILETLGHFDGNRTQTAMALGMCIRTLRNKITQYRKDGVVVQWALGKLKERG